MNNISYIGKVVEVKMDRPLGSKHPKHGWTYGTNYGFIPGTMAPDGEELDAYVLEVNEPLDTFKGKVIAVIHRTNDDDDKLVVVPEDVELLDEEIRKQTHYQEQWFESVILRGKTDTDK
ncbi:MAG: inorganic pyrophosphatase [Candidatus Liptonbacteria bacterium CG11_big_fil_rev_8_21_14_0_20_35_14]|uniref:inorganic diphosphatase n=1 Tax=Candidatus Liptonbacteria bacterium CG11_big_fil_rev_8_21_14_0_20_35_14 TaxID=1974634 RepID=A0A2H0N836_9BACT|nr:MAG: inorganic pyrophosphatase [Candidatus Liptonbacteria bacterium CG11_big_fil_rev_8_21_14_0_20_35_14]